MAFVRRAMPKDSSAGQGLLGSMRAPPQEAHEQLVPHYLAMYESLSDKELQQYLDMTVSAESRWFDALERTAIRTAMRDAGTRMGAAMIRFAMRVKDSL